MSNSPGKSAEKILVRGVNWLGDAVMTTPALRRLREAMPQSQISLLTPAKLTDLWRSHPALDSVISFEAGESVKQIGKRLKERKFDLAIIFPNSPRSAIESWLARIPEIVGYARPWRNFLLTRAVKDRAGTVLMRKRSVSEIRKLISGEAKTDPPIPASAHHLFHYLHLVGAVGASTEPCAPLIAVLPQELEALKARWDLNTDELPALGINPGAEYGPAKRWPVKNFVQAARAIQAKVNCQWLIFGGAGDRDVAREITQELTANIGGQGVAKVVNLAGETTLRELCAALALCRVVITNDTGPMHLAAAVGTPVVVPFGSTSPEFTAPGLPGDPKHSFLRGDVPCAPCFRPECPIDFRCMQQIGPESVVDAVLRALAMGPVNRVKKDL